ncbi:hypothetical protein HHI36_000233 [Cryptolaemus montrouzieri]|uniref:Pre-mRNA-processing factor 39 n=1 Tax=Cryptolaemus montrouzieri TaxID=559131 RepID=A0ABD2P402_9CUCU
MDAESEQTPPTRRTRSGTKVKASPQTSPTKPTTRKTKKKVVVMEVEVSDEDDVSNEVDIKDEKSEDELIKGSKKVEDEIDKTEEEKSELEALNEDNKVEDYFIMSEDDINISNQIKSNDAENTEITKENGNSTVENIDGDVGKSEEKPLITASNGKTNDIKKEIEDYVQIKNSHEIKVEEIKEEVSTSETVETNATKKQVKVEEETKDEIKMEVDGEESKTTAADPDTENISEDELPTVQAVKVPETEEVSDEELPGPKRAELPADTEVVSEDELPTVKKDTTGKRKLTEGEYDPCSPTSESEAPAKKVKEDKEADKEKDEKLAKLKKLPELDKFWKAVNDDPTDFTGWTYLLQYVDQENDMEAAREAYDAFLSHYPYCYGYWRKYADYEKRKGNKKKCEEVFERGLKAIPLSVDLWIHYLNYVKSTRQEDEEYVRSQFDRAISACGLEFRSDRLWDSYIKWESEGKRLQRVTSIFDKLLATPTQGYTAHFESFQEHITTNPPNKVLEVDEFLALRKEVKNLLKHETTEASVDSDAPPGDEDLNKLISSDEETKLIRERIISIRRKIHKNTITAVSARWNFEEGIKRPYFHVKPLERCQLKNWQDYLDFEIQQGDKTRTIVLFERCLIACALYEEFWLKFIHYLDTLEGDDIIPKIKDVYERACTIHHLKKPNLHLQWAIFEETHQNANRAAEILVNLEKCVPNLIQIANRRISLERRRGDHEKCCQLFEHYINNSKNKLIASYHSLKFSRFQHKILKNHEKAIETLKSAISKDPVNPRLYLQLIDLTLQKDDVTEKEIIEILDSFLEKENVEVEQKVLFAQRKLEYLEDFSSDIESVQKASDEYQKILKLTKDTNLKRKDAKSDTASNKKEKSSAPPSTQSGPYGPYGAYNQQGSYQYSGSQPQGQYNYQQYGQNEQYPYQNWQYPQGGYGGYNQWGSYGGGYGY